MYNDDDNEFSFEDSNELDPVEKAQLQEQYEKEIESSMRFAYDQIAQMGIANWSQNVSFDIEKKCRILENMIEWHASPDREEYEKAALLKRGLDSIRNTK